MSTSNWRRISIKDGCTSIIDCVNKTAPTTDSATSYKMLRTTNIKKGWIDVANVSYVTEETFNKWTRRQIPKKGDIVLTREAPLGEVGMIRTDDNVFLGQRLVAYRTDPNKIDNKFLLYAFLSHDLQSQIKSLGFGATVEHMRVPDAEKLTVYLPEINVQKQIASVIGAYDDLIEINNKRIKILEEMAQRLYTEWFVFFRFPGHEKKALTETETSFGRIPHGWKIKKNADVMNFIRGRSYNSAQIDDKSGDYYIVNLKSFNRGGGFRYDGAKYYTGPIKDNQVLGRGDVVVAVTDMTNDRAVISRPARIPSIAHKVTFSADVVKIVSDKLPSAFIYYSLLDYRFTESTKNKASGANVLHLKPAAILEHINIIPSSDVLQKFAKYCDEIIGLVDNILEQNQHLAHARDMLIPQLITGRRELKPAAVAEESSVLSPYRDAVTFSLIVRDLTKTYGKSPSRFEVQKNKYFVDRFFIEDIRSKYSAMAHGPYDKVSRYRGGESIAIKSGYVSKQGDTKFGIGRNLAKAEKYYASKLSQVEPILSYVRGKSDIELEILTTTDYAIFDMVSTQHRKVVAKDVLGYISNHPVWHEKVGRLALDETKIAKFMADLKELSTLGIRYPQI